MENNTAKKIFFRYNGSHSLMKNDGIYEKYKTFAVPREKETEWLREIENHQTEALKCSDNVKFEFVKLCQTVRKTKNTEQINGLYSFLIAESVKERDALSRLYMIEAFIDLLRAFRSTVSISKYRNPIRQMISDIAAQSSIVEVLRRASVMLAQLADL